MAPRRKRPTGPPPLKGERHNFELKNYGKIATSRELGRGGFGIVYLAKLTTKRDEKHDCVAKVEHESSSGLFPEMKGMQNLDLVHYKRKNHPSWVAKSKLKHFPFALMFDCNITTIEGIPCRAMALELAGTSLQSLISSSNKGNDHSAIPLGSVYSLGLQLTEALRYCHEHEYTHGDVKPENICISAKNGNEARLIDFGCCEKLKPDMLYEEIAARKHDGTMPFTCIDAHAGAIVTRRGDLELVFYTLLKLATGTLPWWSTATQKYTLKQANAVGDKVAAMKRELFPYSGPSAVPKSAIDKAVANLEKHVDAPNVQGLCDYLRILCATEYNAAPAYDKLAKAMLDGMSSCGYKASTPIAFSSSSSNKKATAKAASKAAPKEKKRTKPATPMQEKKKAAKPAKTKRAAAKTQPTEPEVQDAKEIAANDAVNSSDVEETGALHDMSLRRRRRKVDYASQMNHSISSSTDGSDDLIVILADSDVIAADGTSPLVRTRTRQEAAVRGVTTPQARPRSAQIRRRRIIVTPDRPAAIEPAHSIASATSSSSTTTSSTEVDAPEVNPTPNPRKRHKGHQQQQQDGGSSSRRFFL